MSGPKTIAFAELDGGVTSLALGWKPRDASNPYKMEWRC